MLKFIKIIHTVIWAMMAFCVFYILWCGLTGTMGLYLWIAIAVIIFEGLVLLVNDRACPLTNIAKKYTHNRKDNFDIYLPELLARHNKSTFTTLFIIGVVLVIIRSIV